MPRQDFLEAQDKRLECVMIFGSPDSSGVCSLYLGFSSFLFAGETNRITKTAQIVSIKWF